MNLPPLHQETDSELQRSEFPGMCVCKSFKSRLCKTLLAATLFSTLNFTSILAHAGDPATNPATAPTTQTADAPLDERLTYLSKQLTASPLGRRDRENH